MHDPTEGGVAGGIHEMADAANLGVKIFEDKIPIAQETLEICNFFHIDPLQLISSGALLISANPHYAEIIVEELCTHGVQAAIIGEFLKNPEERLLINAEGTIKDLSRPLSDHLWMALEKIDMRI